MALRDSALYKKLHVDKFLGDARDAGGRAYPIPFQHTVVTGGEAIADTVNLCVLPANCEVVGFEAIGDGVMAATGTIAVGDSGDADRYMVAKVFATAEDRGDLAFAGMRYRPTADTIVVMVYAVAAAVAGKVLKGRFWVIPGA